MYSEVASSSTELMRGVVSGWKLIRSLIIIAYYLLHEFYVVSEDYNYSNSACMQVYFSCTYMSEDYNLMTVCISSPIQDVGQRLMDLNVFMEIQGTIYWTPLRNKV